MTYDPENVFAKILRGELPAHKVYEDDDVLSFMDIFPQIRGHTLVIPKVEATGVMDMEPAALATLFQKTQMIVKAIDAALNPDGIQIIQRNGAASGQTVFHAHINIVPMWEGVPLVGHAHGNMADHDELAALAAAIKAKL